MWTEKPDEQAVGYGSPVPTLSPMIEVLKESRDFIKLIFIDSAIKIQSLSEDGYSEVTNYIQSWPYFIIYDTQFVSVACILKTAVNSLHSCQDTLLVSFPWHSSLP